MRPTREQYPSNRYSYFVSTQTWARRRLFSSERWADLLCQVLNHYGEASYSFHAFVVMPDHLHCLITPAESLEKAVQLIKGGYSFRAKREFQSHAEIWQSGFTDHRIRDEEDWKHRLNYIRMNPVEARLVEDSALYPYIGFPNSDFPRGLKPFSSELEDCTG